jgi:hypothetical protein
MNEERIGKCLRQVEHIRGHLWLATVLSVLLRYTNYDYPFLSYDSSYQSLTPEVFRVFMLFYLFVVQYVTLTLFCLSVMVSTVAADLKKIS